MIKSYGTNVNNSNTPHAYTPNDSGSGGRLTRPRHQGRERQNL
ncbi:hypothetical protein D4764_06G0002960 [Takifugu flavidus]|uniref:Uncharacterized protein n=1 Tax=Takifugu flavidus TaxID=433684 RepID=A0A5C6MUL8_9TELE|nr:hypothetical protein D4764_06G0002960 [Takifugu flavidus]